MDILKLNRSWTSRVANDDQQPSAENRGLHSSLRSSVEESHNEEEEKERKRTWRQDVNVWLNRSVAKSCEEKLDELFADQRAASHEGEINYSAVCLDCRVKRLK